MNKKIFSIVKIVKLSLPSYLYIPTSNIKHYGVEPYIICLLLIFFAYGVPNSDIKPQKPALIKKIKI